MPSLTTHGLKTIYDTVRRAERVLNQKRPYELRNLFADDARLIISPSNQCTSNCYHCISNSVPNGKVMPYGKFVKIDPEFIRIFSAADFGRRGSPLLYQSGSHDIADMVEWLNKNGINIVTLALSIQRNHVPVIDKLENLVSQRELHIETMITYHHYFSNLDVIRLAHDFNASIKNFIRFSKEIKISLVGDGIIKDENSTTKAEQVQSAFRNNWRIIFKDIRLTQTQLKNEEDGYGYEIYTASYSGKDAAIVLPPLDVRVYPFGRFRKYLSQKEILDWYSEQFEKMMGDYVCPDLIKWPGIIIEPNGDLNLCASFEAINCKGAVVSNIFQAFSQVKKELMEFYERELRWFIDNLDNIISGKVSTCKIKNRCYAQSGQ